MTYAERLQKALGVDIGMIDNTTQKRNLDSLLVYAYMAGRESGVKEACDRATERWRGQLKQARACKYWKMATSIVGGPDAFTGGKGFIYHPDYAGDYTEIFENDIWKGE